MTSATSQGAARHSRAVAAVLGTQHVTQASPRATGTSPAALVPGELYCCSPSARSHTTPRPRVASSYNLHWDPGEKMDARVQREGDLHNCPLASQLGGLVSPIVPFRMLDRTQDLDSTYSGRSQCRSSM